MIDEERFPVDPWQLIETSFVPEAAGVSETLFSLGNGYLGMRGNNAEGRRAHEHGTFINGLHETWPIRHAENAYGFAEVGQTIVNAPDAKVMRLYVDDEPLNLETAELLDYRRWLDFRTGILSRELLWRTPSGKRVRVRGTRMVSFVERHLAIMTQEFEMLDDAAPVTVSSQLINRQDGETEYGMGASAPGARFDPRRADRIDGRVLVPGEHWQDSGHSALSYRVANSGMTVAVVAHHTIETVDDFEIERALSPDIAREMFNVDARPGHTTRITKVVAYHSGNGTPTSELVERAHRTVHRVVGEGVDEHRRRQRAWLDDFWDRSDVRVGHDDRLQQAIRWNLLQLAQASARGDGLGIPAKGLTGSGYSGHYFWDGEIYVLPFLIYTDPNAARNALRMREEMLPAARRRARQLNEDGALFPWRTINGEEASAYYAAGTAQYHIDADITYALAKYVRATGDEGFLAAGAIDIAVETARMWTTLGFWRVGDAGESFHVHGVTGPDEYTTVVDDNLFTNVMARFNLRYAAASVRELGERDPEAYARMVQRLELRDDEPENWLRAADAMAIPYSEALGVHPQDSHFLEHEVWDLANTPPERRPLLLYYHPLVIYRFQVLKQADVVLALFLQGDHFTEEEKRADFEYYDPLTTGDSSLSAVVQSIIAAEIGYRDLALDYFRDALFVDLGDLHGNAADGVHVASLGGVWAALVNGFGGMRDHRGELSFDPRLPEDWPSLVFHLQWQGSPMRVTVEQDAITIDVLSGRPVQLSVRGQMHVIAPGEPRTIALPDQGPRLRGAPSQRAVSRNRREDGTLMTASLPTITDAIPVVTSPVNVPGNDREWRETPPAPTNAS